MPGEPSVDFTVKFSRTARVLEYADPRGQIRFTFDTSPGDPKCLILEHYPPGMTRAPSYDVAFERSKRYLESCGFRVEIVGR